MSALLVAIVEVLNRRKGKVLDLAQLSMREAQFRAFKRLFLNEFGREGAEQELQRVVAEYERQRNGRE